MKILQRVVIFIITINIFFNQVALGKDINKLSIPEQVWKEFSTPVTTKARYILLGSLVAAGMVYVNKAGREYNKRETFDDAKPVGNLGYIGETIGWGYLNVLYMLGHFGYGYFKKDDESLKASEHMLKASTYTLFATTSLKLMINERRPGFPEDKSSFPSGHASMSFAFASVVAARHGWFYGSLAYGLGTYISVSRINDDWHYLHDVLIGMGIGASYGWGLHYAYKKGLPFQFTVVPTNGGAFGMVGKSF